MLGLDFVIGMGAVIGPLLHPATHRAPPFSARSGLNGTEFGGEFLYHLIELLEHAANVAHDRNIRVAVLAHFGRVNIHMDHAGVAREGVQGTGDAVIKTSAESDEQIAV